MMHYYLHHFRPRGRLGRMLRERHMRHHFQDDTRGFGISAPYWDEVFRTSPRAQPILAMSGIRLSGARPPAPLDSRPGTCDSQALRATKGTEPWPPPTSTGSS